MNTTTETKLPVIRHRLNLSADQIPWDQIRAEFDQAPQDHSLEKGRALSTWNWGENHRTDLDPWFEPVRNQIQELVQAYFGVEEGYRSWAMNSWMNRHYATGSTSRHTHRQCDMVFSCYLSVPKDSGAFLIEWEGQWWRIPVESGDMLIFPGEVEHATEINRNPDDLPRIVLTVNAGPTGMIWNSIPTPDQLLERGMTMPQALGQIREQYLSTHHLFQERKHRLIQRLQAGSNIELQPGVYEDR